MTMANMSDPTTMYGAPVHGSDGGKLGKVDSIYFDNDTDQPEWAAACSAATCRWCRWRRPTGTATP